MCTAIAVSAKNFYFGRNLDNEFVYGEKVTVTPKNYPFHFTGGKVLGSHCAIIGMASVVDGYPLYFDAVNEKGLGMAGLSFPDNAVYNNPVYGKENIASFEVIPYILTTCADVGEAKKALENANITNIPFRSDLPPTPLHWIISDKSRSITVEQTKNGLSLFDNPCGVLTNNPTFDIQLFNLTNYLSLSPHDPHNGFSDTLALSPYCKGMGALGLPGDLSSMSRFVKAAFTKLNSVYGNTESEAVTQFFHVLYSVYQQKGCVITSHGYEITSYSCCCNCDKGVYYYTTYRNHRINAVDMHLENLDADTVISYPLDTETEFNIVNKK